MRLPGLGVSYAMPATAQRRSRARSCGLPEGRRLYVCPQSLFKIHPAMDALFARLLAADPGGVLLFFQATARGVTDALRRAPAARARRARDRALGPAQVPAAHERRGLPPRARRRRRGASTRCTGRAATPASTRSPRARRWSRCRGASCAGARPPRCSHLMGLAELVARSGGRVRRHRPSRSPRDAERNRALRAAHRRAPRRALRPLAARLSPSALRDGAADRALRSDAGGILECNAGVWARAGEKDPSEPDPGNAGVGSVARQSPLRAPSRTSSKERHMNANPEIPRRDAHVDEAAVAAAAALAQGLRRGLARRHPRADARDRAVRHARRVRRGDEPAGLRLRHRGPYTDPQAKIDIRSGPAAAARALDRGARRHRAARGPDARATGRSGSPTRSSPSCAST